MGIWSLQRLVSQNSLDYAMVRIGCLGANISGLMTNVLVTAMLLTGLCPSKTRTLDFFSDPLAGGSAVVTSLTGMPTAAACFLLPVGVVMYTIAGGIKVYYVYVYSPIYLIKTGDVFD